MSRTVRKGACGRRQTPHQLENLRWFAVGVSGNPQGRPPRAALGIRFAAVLAQRIIAEDVGHTVAELLVRAADRARDSARAQRELVASLPGGLVREVFRRLRSQGSAG